MFALFWWMVVPLLLLVLDGVAVFALLLLGIVLRGVFRRPWRVLAACPTEQHEVRVVGWCRALRARDQIATEIEAKGAAAWPTLAGRDWQ